MLPQIPVTYPATAPEIALPELDGKTAKMFRYVNCIFLSGGGAFILTASWPEPALTRGSLEPNRT